MINKSCGVCFGDELKDYGGVGQSNAKELRSVSCPRDTVNMKKVQVCEARNPVNN